MRLSTPLRGHAIWLAILVALASWSYIAVWAANTFVLSGFYVGRYAAWTLGFLALALGAAVATRGFDRSRRSIHRPYAMGASTLLLFQSAFVFVALQEWLSIRLGGSASWAITAVLAGAVLLLTFRVSATPSIRTVFAVLTVFLVAVPAFGVARWVLEDAFGRAPLPGSSAVPMLDAVETAPDVFVVVLDAYARSDVLEQQFAFDNTRFESALADLGVAVVPLAKSNYDATQVSVASLLDARYPAVGDSDDPSLWRLHTTYAGDNALFTSLRAAGHEIHLFDNAWTFTQCGPIVDHCYSTLLTEIDHVIAQRTPLPLVMTSLLIDPWTRGSVDQLRQATDLARTASDRPRLVFVHALIPHAPFQLNEVCQEYSDSRLDGYAFIDESPGHLEVRRTAYVAQLECTNSLVIDLVAAIPADAIILITGDHGPKPTDVDPDRSIGTTPEQVLARFGTFTAYRFPEPCDSVPDGASLVVTAASLFNCVGIPVTDEIARTPDQAERYFMWEPADGEGRVTEVSSIVARVP